MKEEELTGDEKGHLFEMLADHREHDIECADVTILKSDKNVFRLTCRTCSILVIEVDAKKKQDATDLLMVFITKESL